MVVKIFFLSFLSYKTALELKLGDSESIASGGGGGGGRVSARSHSDPVLHPTSLFGGEHFCI